MTQTSELWQAKAHALTSCEVDVPLLTHPGPVAPVRRSVLGGSNQKVWRLKLAAGQTLQDAVLDAMALVGIKTAALDIVQAEFSQLRYFEIATSDDVEPVAHYTTPPERSGPLLLIGAGVTIGRTAEGVPAIHCHAITVDSEGKFVGGHLLPEGCCFASDGVAMLHALDHMDLVIGDDPEIGLPVFQPQLRENSQ